jgi:hypothetical protein
VAEDASSGSFDAASVASALSALLKMTTSGGVPTSADVPDGSTRALIFRASRLRARLRFADSNLARYADSYDNVGVSHACRTREPMRINRILKYVSLAVIVVGASMMVGMLTWAHRLDADFSGRYACCTQQADADFHRRFWSKFFVGGP